jgi:predicted transcriptional regulator
MNSWKLNGQAGHHYRSAICKTLNIPHREIYKTVKDIDSKGVITTKDGRRFIMKLEEIDQNKDG